MQKAETSRLYWLDVLRVAAAFAVVVLHASASFVVLYTPNPDLSWWIANGVEALVRWCVPIFVMISGSLLLAKPMGDSPLPFYRRHLGRLLIVTVTWTLFYLAYQAYRDKSFDLHAALISIYLGIPYYHLWYLYMVLGLYLVVPFINRFVSASSRRWLLWATGISFVLAIVYSLSPIFVPGGNGIFLTMFPPYIAYFLAGHLLTTAEKSFLPPRLALVVALACAVAIALITGVLAARWGGEPAWALTYNYFDPLVIVMSLCLFSFIKDTVADPATDKPRPLVARFITWLAPLTLGIYVIHTSWLGYFQSRKIEVNYFSATGILASVVTTLVIATAITLVLRRIRWVRAIVR